MFLSGLELIGFKSFAGKTKFNFTEGITAIVGPNGCGKSNIVDAVRWVLGEQKSSVLRSESMDSVIFNGTATRKPLSMSEVVFTLENNKNVLSSDYSTVQITRRLFRNGDSNYLINKNRVRLKDINDLFMDTGIGPDSYSVIELKMVEEILNGKIDSRRRMIEEAAGVTRYKARRKEAANKLKRVEEDLERVKDIIIEVEQNVNRLSRQAAKTRRFNTISEELKGLEIILFKYEYENYNNILIKFKEEVKLIENNLKSISNSVSNYENQIASLSNKRNQLEEKINELIQSENIVKQELSDKKRELAVNSEKINNSKNSLIRLNDEIDNSNSKKEKLIEDIANKQNELKEFEIKIEKSLLDLEQLRKNREIAKTELDNAFEIMNSENERINRLNNLINSNLSIRENNEKRIDSILSKLNNYKTEINSSNDLINLNLSDLNKTNSNLKDKANELKDKKENLALSEEKLNNLNIEINSVQNQINEVKNSIGGKKASLEFLESLSVSDDTTQFLLKNLKSWSNQSKPSTLAELISVDDEYKEILATVLGDYLQLLVVDSKNDVINAINYLKENKKSKRGIICKELIPKSSSLNTPKRDYVLLNDLIESDDEIKYVIKHLFGNIAIAKDEKNALDLIKEKDINIAITEDSKLFNKAGIIKGGGSNKGETASIGKNKRIKVIENELERLNEELKKSMANYDVLNNEKNAINIALIKSEINSLDIELQNLNKIKLQTELKIQSIENNKAILDKNILSSNKEIEELQEETDRVSSLIKETKLDLTKIQSDKENKTKTFNEAEKKFSSITENIQKEEILNIQIKSEKNSIISEIKRLESDLGQEKLSQEARTKNIETNSALIEELSKRNDALNKILSDLEEKLKYNLQELNNLQAEKKSNDENIQSIGRELRIQKEEHDKLKEQQHKIELKISENTANLNNLTQRALQSYEIELNESGIQIPEDFSVTETKIQVDELKVKLNNLGSINFEAVTEFEEQSERLSFYNKQVKDLVESEKTLKETIKEINITATERFEETFKKVDTNFQMLFKKLFSDQGDAKLSLTDEDILESEIEITAKPPGKRPRSIDMLSGGEKTLTAIALLFAIYLVKPSPFCILDEVDAPLDDSNLVRFCNLVKEFSKKTQFLIVTHQKITMEVADTLYGITQEEQGISKIVSVKLQKQGI